MSLINQVLQDLESRRDVPATPKLRPVLDDLRPVMGAAPRTTTARHRWWPMLIVVVAGASAYLAWNRWPASPSLGQRTAVVVQQTEAAKPVQQITPRQPMVNSPNASSPATATLQPPETSITIPPPAATVSASATTPHVAGNAISSVDQNPVTTDSATKSTTIVQKVAEEKSTGEQQRQKINISSTAAVSTAISEDKPKPAPIVTALAKPVPATATKRKTPGTAKSSSTQKAVTADKAKTRSVRVEQARQENVMHKKARPLTPAQRAETAYREGARKLQKRLPTTAEKDLRTALTLNPRHIKARELLVGMFLQQGRQADAQVLLEQGLKEAPNHPSFTLLLARIYFDYGVEDKALTMLEEARHTAETNADYQVFLATLYQRANRHDQAVQAYSQAIRLRPSEGKWWLGLAISLEAQEKWGAARVAYERAARSGKLDRNLLPYAQKRLAQIKNK